MARGDEEFVEFARSGSAWLVRAAYLITGDQLDAEELAQATLVRTYAVWPKVRREGAHAYARTVLLNLLRDRWRRPIREDAFADLPDAVTAPDPAHQVTDRRWVISLLATLSPQERAVVMLRHYFDLSEAQTASHLRVSLGTVKSTNSRALAKLRVAPEAVTEGWS
ncbi:SigE family RNA polymerase sigma factor [Kineosporia succinea]|uniref:RNA polymerase sigma-70 factor (Sigma-E family) n=1 Tax=Kineosporia succinea TaxID=84632 RepID=A0ABT9PDW9_9ACTN|nr:SigE family RNA polymerase sigma factor [Kineosporia succinea]MDP9830904.1 RNA polymerase sigma-70 factor (sigma-E family) [Kineosporia succinea]